MTAELIGEAPATPPKPSAAAKASTQPRPPRKAAQQPAASPSRKFPHFT